MRRTFLYEYTKGTEFRHTREDNIKIYAEKIGSYLWSGFMWPRIGFFEHGTELSSYVNSGEGRAVSQAVSCWLPTAAARVRVRPAC
jgi:hypothetical protein